jgi:dihydroflavonol-4-reductase
MDLVIGGSGFIGAHLVKELVGLGRKVKVYDIHPFPADEEEQPADQVMADIADRYGLRTAMSGCETVYHLAANPQLWEVDPCIFDRVNRQGTENVLWAAQSVGVGRLIYTSTESILAPRKHRGLITEETVTCLEDMIGPYCRSKFMAEKSIFAAAEKGFPAVIVSPTLPIGPGDRNLTPPSRMIADFLRGKIPGYIECTMNFVDVRDVAVGHVLAAEFGKPGFRYILSGHNLTLAKFFSLLHEASGCPMPRFKVPLLLALTWAIVEEWISRATGRRPKSSAAGVRLCRRSLAFDGAKSWQALGHKPKPIEESIRDAVLWHRKQIESPRY